MPIAAPSLLTMSYPQSKRRRTAAAIFVLFCTSHSSISFSVPQSHTTPHHRYNVPLRPPPTDQFTRRTIICHERSIDRPSSSSPTQKRNKIRTTRRSDHNEEVLNAMIDDGFKIKRHLAWKNGAKSTKKRLRQQINKKKLNNRIDFLQDDMLNHRILTREEEFSLGEKISQAERLRESIELLSSERRSALKLNVTTSSASYLNKKVNKGDDDDNDEPAIESLTDLPYARESRALSSSSSSSSSTSLPLSPTPTPLPPLLTDADIIHTLHLPGGRPELLRILTEGRTAREELISCNLRLVTSIARKWMSRSEHATPTLISVYGDGETPSFEEVVQEGILGLIRAVEKYEPQRRLRFSTYATYWITNYVRMCFQDAKTGCLKVPAALHEIKRLHGIIMKRYYDMGEPLPPDEIIAKEIGVNVNRLRVALRCTKNPVSMDAAISNGSANKGSAAGGDSADRPLLLSDTLPCPEIMPEDYVELSLLRQCLENAMATELSPHERDVVRLRLGLDDGQTRTVREVVEVCGGSISQAEVRSAEKRAFRKLRSPNAMHSHNLMAFLDEVDEDYDQFRR